MTTFPQPNLRSSRRAPAAGRQRQATYRIEEAYWGYVLRQISPLSKLKKLLQMGATLCGIFGLAMTAGLWLVPLQEDSVALVAFRLVASLVLAGIGSSLLWFGSRGTDAELQVDIAQGELREVIRNRAGLPTLTARYAFRDIGGVFLARRAGGCRGQAKLVLRLGNTAQVIIVAAGPEETLLPLRDRLGCDLMVRPRQPEAANSPAQMRLPPLARPAA
ncbi:hypothetical protein ACXN5S_18745 [Pseudoroseicyclus sp. H15]